VEEEEEEEEDSSGSEEEEEEEVRVHLSVLARSQQFKQFNI
jgi:hypothetical protein